MSAKHPKFKIGDLVVIKFLDHAEDGPAIEFRVAGWVHKFDRKSIEVLSWDYVDPDEERPSFDFNPKRFAIVRAAISSIRVVPDDPVSPVAQA